MNLLGAQDSLTGHQLLPSLLMFPAVFAAAYVGLGPLKDFLRHREQEYDRVLRHSLLIDVSPRSVTILSLVAIAVLGLLGYAVFALWGSLIAAVAGVFLPTVIIVFLRRRRLARLENQLVPGVQTLASGVRAGLNLVQSMQLIARDGPIPLRQEFAHLLREYEYGVTLETAMRNSTARIGSGDFGLLFSALETHRERGGDLGETLDRIADSIREIQRLEMRVKSLTAQGRATANWLAVMPFVILGILYAIDPVAVREMFIYNIGKLLVVLVVVLTAIAFLWIRKIVSIDV